MLMLFVAAVGIFCAYPVHWIHQRHEFVKKHAEDALHFDIMTKVGRTSPWMNEPWVGGEHNTHSSTHSGFVRRKTPKHTSTLLWLFGEQERREVKLVFRSDSLPNAGRALRSIPPEKTDLAESLFPEADIRYVVYFVE